MKDVFKPGLLDPKINQGKELAVLERYNLYSGIKVEFGFSPSTPFTTIFRLAEKGVVIQGWYEDGSDLRIPWSEISGVSAHESFWDPITLVINLKDGRDCYIFFVNWSTTHTHIHLIRAISRIILSEIGKEID